MTEDGSGGSFPEHVFISFAQEDVEIAQSIAHELSKKQIPNWVAYAKLVPGTSDWEAAIRDAIDRAFAVVVLASPASRTSKYVRGELDIAEARGCQIFPVWIAGIVWSDCISLGMVLSQYIDTRGAQWSHGVDALCTTLAECIRNVTPKHYRVSPYRRISPQYGGIVVASTPPGYISVDLKDSNNDEGEGGTAAFFRVADFPNVRSLLDELYVSYLADRFEPFTYGQRWILNEQKPFGRLLVPWSWLAASPSNQQVSRDWLLGTRLEDCGLLPSTYWAIQEPQTASPAGLAINDGRVLLLLQSGGKALMTLIVNGILIEKPLDEVTDNYTHRCVISGIGWEGDGSLDSRDVALVQSKSNLDESEIRHFLGHRTWLYPDLMDEKGARQ